MVQGNMGRIRRTIFRLRKQIESCAIDQGDDRHLYERYCSIQEVARRDERATSAESDLRKRQ